MFTDIFSVFDSGKAANIIGLMSDIGHWKDFGEFLKPENLGVMTAPVVTAGAQSSLPYDGGIGYAVAKWTKDPAVAADLVRSLTSTDALHGVLRRRRCDRLRHHHLHRVAADRRSARSSATSRPASRRCTWRCPRRPWT